MLFMLFFFKENSTQTIKIQKKNHLFMHTGMLHLHSILRWIVILMAVWAIVKMASGRNGNKAFTASDKKPALFLMISMDVQLLVGLVLYFTGPWGLKNIQNQGMGNIMKDAASRFFAIEHLLGMLIALVLVHIGYAATKKASNTDQKKFDKAFWCFVVAFIVILASIPWPFREALGRGWMPHTA